VILFKVIFTDPLSSAQARKLLEKCTLQTDSLATVPVRHMQVCAGASALSIIERQVGTSRTLNVIGRGESLQITLPNPIITQPAVTLDDDDEEDVKPSSSLSAVKLESDEKVEANDYTSLWNEYDVGFARVFERAHARFADG
jgi:hypothetical protein